MAAYGEDLGGNQIFVTLSRGTEWPPVTVDVRAKYDETVSDIKAKASEKTGVPVDRMQLFWHHKELQDHVEGVKTLEEMHLHTGFSLSGYDLRSPPHYFPPVKLSEDVNGKHLVVVPCGHLADGSTPDGCHVDGYMPGYNDNLQPVT